MDQFKAWVNDIAQKPLAYKATYLCIISFLIIAIFYIFIGTRQRIELVRLRYQAENLTEKIREIQTVLVKPEDLNNQINQLKIIKKNLEQRYKIDFNFLNLLHALSQINSDLGVTYLAIDPGEQEVLEYYSTFTVHIFVIGTFQQLILYLTKLFDLNFLMIIKELHMNPVIENQDMNHSHLEENIPIDLEMTILVYRFE